jgi:hypothetical protein
MSGYRVCRARGCSEAFHPASSVEWYCPSCRRKWRTPGHRLERVLKHTGPEGAHDYLVAKRIGREVFGDR